MEYCIQWYYWRADAAAQTLRNPLLLSGRVIRYKIQNHISVCIENLKILENSIVNICVNGLVTEVGNVTEVNQSVNNLKS